MRADMRSNCLRSEPLDEDIHEVEKGVRCVGLNTGRMCAYEDDVR